MVVDERTSRRCLENLVAVVIAFIFCYTPFHAQRLITSGLDVHNISMGQQRAARLFFFVSGILYYLGSTINPIFYHLFSRKYREACRRTMARLVHCQEQDPRRSSYYHYQQKYETHSTRARLCSQSPLGIGRQCSSNVLDFDT